MKSARPAAKALRSLGIATLGDLIEYFPRDYQYETEEKPLDKLREGEIGIVRGSDGRQLYLRRTRQAEV